jgi:protein Xni
MHLLIIDAMNLIRRVYAALEGGEWPVDGTRARSVSIATATAEAVGASHCVVVFEEKCETWRHTLWPDYKLGRAPMPEILYSGLAEIRNGLKDAGFACMDVAGWEADDIVASLADRASTGGLEVTILSTDKGFCQLLTPHIQLRNHFDRTAFDLDGVKQKWGLLPQQLVDFWAMTGDTTNHLPGVPGIGPKGAGSILDACGSLDMALAFPQLLPEKLAATLVQYWQQALLTRVLATLRRDVPLGINLHDLRWRRAQVS